MEHVLEHEVLHVLIGGDDGRVRVHQLDNAHAAEVLLQGLLLTSRLGRIVQEPADEADPQPVQEVAAENLRDSPEDEQEADPLPDDRSDIGRSSQAPSDPPDDRAKHPPPVEREARQQVEEAQQQVDHGQIAQDAADRRAVGRERLAHRPQVIDRTCPQRFDQRRNCRQSLRRNFL